MFNFFAVEVAFQLYPGNPTQQMQQLIRQSPVNQNYTQKWEFYRDYCRLLLSAASRFEFGVWEFSEGSGAEEEYEEWLRGTEADTAASVSQGAVAGSNQHDPYRDAGENRYGIAMALFLVQDGSNSDAAIRRITTMPQSAFWTRQTISTLLNGIGYINFATVKSDAVFVRPGHEAYALTYSELRTERYQYLRPLT
ncbi:MAG: hypothetical protein U0165_03795 [Polyangiaceae bacterium]